MNATDEWLNEFLNLTSSDNSSKFIAEVTCVEGMEVKTMKDSHRYKINGIQLNIETIGLMKSLSIYTSELRSDYFGTYRQPILIDSIMFDSIDHNEIIKLAIAGIKHYDLDETSDVYIKTEAKVNSQTKTVIR